MIEDQPLLTRVLLLVWSAGTSTFTLSLLIAPPVRPNWTAMWLVSGVGYSMTVALWLRRRRLPPYAADVSRGIR